MVGDSEVDADRAECWDDFGHCEFGFGTHDQTAHPADVYLIGWKSAAAGKTLDAMENESRRKGCETGALRQTLRVLIGLSQS